MRTIALSRLALVLFCDKSNFICMEKSGYFQGLKIKKSASVIDKKGKKSYTITNKYTQIKGRADPALSRERKKEKK